MASGPLQLMQNNLVSFAVDADGHVTDWTFDVCARKFNALCLKVFHEFRQITHFECNGAAD